jgi:uncharacterized protein
MVFTSSSLRANFFKFVGLNFLWVAFVGLVMFFTKKTPTTEAGISIIKFLYMPAPAIFTLLFERFRWREIIDKYGLNFKRWQFRRVFSWSVLFYSVFTLFYFVLVLLLGNWLKIPGVGYEIIENQEFLLKYNITPPLIVNNLHLLYFISFLNSIFVGLTYNSLFAFGEELAWRGYLWNQVKSIGYYKGNILLGIIWGLWHAPLILQGHNFPGQPYLGVGYMLISTIPLNFILTSSVDRFKTVFAATVIHGFLNASGYTAAAITDAQAPIGTLLGVVSVFSMLCAWRITTTVFHK